MQNATEMYIKVLEIDPNDDEARNFLSEKLPITPLRNYPITLLFTQRLSSQGDNSK
jgi:hypothetical protein